MIKIILFLFAATFFTSCMTQTFVPVRPLQKGENELRLHVSYSFSKFEVPALGFTAYHGLSDKAVIGTSMNNFVIPSSLSYAYYWDKPDQSQNVQFHLNDIFSWDMNPSLEFNYGFSSYSEDSYHSMKAGLCYMASPLTWISSRRNMGWGEFLPILGYKFQKNEMFANVQYIPGITDHYIKYYKENYHSIDFAPDFSKIDDLKDLNFANNDIKEHFIDTLGNGELNYFFILKSGKGIKITKSMPHSEAIDIGNDLVRKRKYKSSQRSDVYVVSVGVYVNKGIYSGNHFAMELDMPKILADFYDENGLRIVEDHNLVEKTISKNNTFFHDFFFSIGTVKYQHYD